ncbi:NAD(+) hydrolase SARM1-like [Saccoglossus kowalevskii]|uniref:ADP-ribosyl cyclase/cyclic ADP-ribose hydrolase n=1 Tax=Saccoglossus kowalevskii TaxID=10224 RepID=A0ABM0MAG1_SACKO|nr:PREDICTED: sterile alpha and TIR motif-containing protein 1-like [Saccoglossus kowalevskii]
MGSCVGSEKQKKETQMDSSAKMYSERSVELPGPVFSSDISIEPIQSVEVTSADGGTMNVYSTKDSSFYTTTTSIERSTSNGEHTVRIMERRMKLKKIASADIDMDTKAEMLSEAESQVERVHGMVAELVIKLKNTDVSVVIQATKDLYIQVDNAWITPIYGRDMAYDLCNTLRREGGLDILLENCKSENINLKHSSAQLLEQVLITENRDYVANVGLESVVRLACSREELLLMQIGTGILESMFKHNEDTCSRVIELGGLQAVLYSCRLSDNIVLQHCAAALANCAMYGGPANQRRMIEHHAPEWLFPLAFSKDDNIKYYACLAISLLAANKDVQKAVVNSGTLDLIEPFVNSHDPVEFAKSNKFHAQGRGRDWLKRLVPLLSCDRREAQILAAFHFAMEAGIKKEQGKLQVFSDIGAIEPLQILASSNNDIASNFAIQALTALGEHVPEKLGDNIANWEVRHVSIWLKGCGFESFIENFSNNLVDGDLLLTISNAELTIDIGMTNSLQRRRFTRELARLKYNARWRDHKEISNWLKDLGPEYNQYTYNLVNCGIDMNMLTLITEEHLTYDAGISNGVHRTRILNAAKPGDFEKAFDSPNKCFSPVGTVQLDYRRLRKERTDVFISYRRSTGSQLASLLKVHLQLRGFTVFIDVEKLEAGKFDNNLLSSVKNAKNFVLVLSPNALDRCINDSDQKDWVHREIVTAIESKCNIVPVTWDFKWPAPENLPEDMRQVLFFNGVKWIHDYQEACVDKLERFLRSQENIPQVDGTYKPKQDAWFTHGGASDGRTSSSTS